MANGKITSIVALTVVATLSVAAITGFQLNEIIAEEEKDKGYTFGEDIGITAVFEFKKATEVSQWEVISQGQGYDGNVQPTFTLEKIVNDDTPWLHHYADVFQHVSRSGLDKYQNEFDVDVLFAKGGDVVREVNYNGCRIVDYEIDTTFDKEEGWNTSKGFAHIEKVDFQCKGYDLASPTFDAMMGETVKANTMSSMDYQSQQRQMVP